MTAIPDHINALADVLKADADVAALVGTRVYGGELPNADNVFMPRACVTLTPAGGVADRFGYVDLAEPRVDVRCFGSTPHQSYAVHRAVHGVLKNMRRNVQGDTMLHSARIEASASTLRDPDTEWPMTLSSWQVLASEKVVT